MTISERKLRSTFKRKVRPVLDEFDGWGDLDPGSETSSWVVSNRDARQLIERSPERVGTDLSASWRGTSRERLNPLASVMQGLVGKIEPPKTDSGRKLSSTVYEMN